MGRWTQYDEDSYRLPDGVVRVAYDADTSRYTFRDEIGQTYQGDPGEEYGITERSSTSEESSPVFEFSKSLPSSPTSDTVSRANAFHCALPASAVTVAPSSSTRGSLSSRHSGPSFDAHTQSKSSEAIPKFVKAVRNTVLPKMQGVVDNVMKRPARGNRRLATSRHDPHTASLRQRLLSDEAVGRMYTESASGLGVSGLGRSKTSVSTLSTTSSLSMSMSKPLPIPDHKLPELPPVPASPPPPPPHDSTLPERKISKVRRVPVPAG